MRLFKKKRSWSDVKIGQFQAIQKIYEEVTTKHEQMIGVLAILEGVPEVELMEKTREDVKMLVTKHSYIDQPLPEKVQKTFKINGITYHVELNPDNMSAYQFADMMQLLRDGQVDKHIHEIMAVIAMPKDAKYKGHEMLERAKLFRTDLSIGIAYPVLLFFCKASEALPSAFNKHLSGKAIAALDTAQASLQNMDGLSPSTRSRIATWLGSKKLEIWKSANFSGLPPTSTTSNMKRSKSGKGKNS
jgi:hypothetical protein